MQIVVNLVVNGESLAVPSTGAPLTIRGLLQHLALSGPVAVEVNRSIVPRARHAEAQLGEGDVVEIVHFVGGG
jgi:thiamine biosynthesis protein ThiS